MRSLSGGSRTATTVVGSAVTSRAVALTALLVGLLLGLSALPLSSAAADTPESEAPAASCSTSGPCAEIIAVTPEILTDESQVSLTVRVSGLTEAMGSDIRLATFMQADPFTSTEEVDSFLQFGRSDGWSTQDTQLTEAEVAAANTQSGAEVSISFDVSDSPLWNYDAWGPYGITVRLLEGGQRTFGDSLASGRTLLLWYPPGSSGTSEVSILISNADALPSAQLSDALSTGVAAALTPEGTIALARNGLAQQVEVVPLPEKQASLSLLATVSKPLLYELAAESRLSESPSKLITLVSDTVLADKGWLGLATLRQASPATVLSPPEGVGELIDNAYTPSSRFLVNDTTGQTIVDTPLSPVSEGVNSAVLDSWEEGNEALTDTSRQLLQLSELSARQRTRAFTAVATQEDPEDLLSLWVNVDAQTLGGDPAQRLKELLDVPWVQPVTLQEMLSSPTSSVPRQQLHDFTGVEALTVGSILEPLEAALETADAVLSAATSESEEDLDARETALEATAAQLSQDERKQLSEEATSQLQELSDVISIVPSSTVNVMGKNVSFPVTVSNSGAVGLQLLIGLEVTDPRLSAPESVAATVPAGGSVTVQVPVTAVGAGQVGVFAVARTPGGATLDVSSEITVNVRADWEDRGTWIIGGALAALFVFGLVRTIRRGRRRATTGREGLREPRGE